jgi:hypothetical protein
MVLDQKYPIEKGKLMITRRHYRTLLTTPRGEVNVHDEQQAPPVYDAIAQAVCSWDIRGIGTYDKFSYEDIVIWLLQYLPEAHDVHSVESLIVQAFTEQQGSSDFSPEQSLMIKYLADNLWSIWTAYRHRSDKPTFYQVRFRSKMRQHYLPRSQSH